MTDWTCSYTGKARNAKRNLLGKLLGKQPHERQKNGSGSTLYPMVGFYINLHKKLTNGCTISQFHLVDALSIHLLIIHFNVIFQ
jgi:hypothetical protein